MRRRLLNQPTRANTREGPAPWKSALLLKGTCFSAASVLPKSQCSCSRARTLPQLALFFSSTNLASSAAQFLKTVLISWQCLDCPEWSWDGRLCPSSSHPLGQHFLFPVEASITATLVPLLTCSNIHAMLRPRGFLFPHLDVTIKLGQLHALVCQGQSSFFQAQLKCTSAGALSRVDLCFGTSRAL